MVISMTGYGRGTGGGEGISILAEIKTVNHRFAEFQIRMPRQFLFLEDKIKKQISEYIKRGRIEVYITIEGGHSAERRLEVDWKLLDEFVQAMSQVKEKYNLGTEAAPGDLLKLDHIFRVVEEVESGEELQKKVLSAVREAASSLLQMRQLEGAELGRDMLGNLHQITAAVGKVELMAPAVHENYRKRLYDRIAEYTGGLVDESRLITETAIFAEKADINEELIRLKSHAAQFENTLSQSEPIGRKLDFLVQEMNREANTIGSKANNSQAAAVIVEIKSLLEKIKEQVQNIE
ncbi:YicC/YloC family endoribonuclease [Peribacillus sp. SCS-26]|uniref:YicC/YloC family endoribonuclease n=1 Tax=Paraperibacillus marinus TaxID=3115295 RepID=UPI003905C5FF